MNLVLNLKSRPDKLFQFRQDNPDLNCEVFYAVDHPDPYKSFCLSQYGMLKHFLKSGEDILQAFEDDCLLVDWVELPVDTNQFDLIYLGCNLHGIPPEQCQFKGLRRVKKAWMSHGIVYTRNCVQWIVQNYDPTTWQMYDDWLSDQLPNLRAYVVSPMIAFQRPGPSDIWGNWADYTETINGGNQLM